MTTATKTKLELGRLVLLSPLAKAVFVASGEDITSYLEKHANQEPGILSWAAQCQSELEAREGGRAFSAYRLKCGTAVFFITESDKSSTCVLLSQEF
jgi:hypothetical protein